MGRIYIQRFEESHPYFNFYMCKNCRTDIALNIDGWNEHSAANSGLKGVRQFFKVINVVIDEKVLRKAGPHTMADIHCVKCMDLIGFKFIEVSTDVERIIKVGDIQLIMEKLEFCDRSDVRAARQKELDDAIALLRKVAEAAEQEQATEMGEKEQAATVGKDEEEEPEEAAEQEQGAEMAENEQAAAVGEQEEEPADAVEQEQGAEIEEQEQAAAVGVHEEEPADAAEQEQGAEMGELEQAATVGKQEDEPAEAAEQEQAVEMGAQEQAAAVEEQ